MRLFILMNESGRHCSTTCSDTPWHLRFFYDKSANDNNLVTDYSYIGIRIATESAAFQIPLMLAWAITIHKSQGKTLEKILVDLGHGAFLPGQVYVAMSRCRRLKDVRLERPLRASEIKVDPQIVRFYQRLRVE